MRNGGVGGMRMLKWLKEIWEDYKEGWSNWWHLHFLAYFKMWIHLGKVGSEQWIKDWNRKEVITEMPPEEIPFDMLEKNI
jgi:hypothetical protein